MFEGLFQPVHLVIILVIVLIIFGPGKLTEVGRALGQSVRELRENASGNASSAAPTTQPTPATTQPIAAAPAAPATTVQATSDPEHSASQ